MSPIHHSERRRSPRLPGELTARWRRGQRLLELDVLDVSLHGFLIGTSEWIAPNQVMDIELWLPDGVASFLVTSRNISAAGIGVVFMFAAPRDSQRWVAYYQSMTARAKRTLAA